MNKADSIKPLEAFSELYVGDYFSDTLEFSVSEHVVFRLLLLQLWLSSDCHPNGRSLVATAAIDSILWERTAAAIEPLIQIAIQNIEFWKEAIRQFDGKRLPPEEWRIARIVTLERDRHKCTYCGSSNNLHVDHIVPVIRGGSNSFDNLTTACAPCNLSKGSKPHYQWNQLRQ